MNPFTSQRFLSFATLLLLLTVHPARAQEKAGWTWKDEHGNTRTRAELDSILNEHDFRGRKDLRGARLVGAKLTGVDLSEADLTYADLTDADLTNADLEGAYLSAADLTKVKLSGAYLLGAYLTGVHVTCGDPTKAHEPCALLNGADLTRAELQGADLGGAFLAGADLTYANFLGADLSKAYLGHAQLNHARMGSADLTRADLSNADLTGAILVGAKLNGATLREADLTGVSLSIAHLKRADLTYTSYLDALVQLRKEFQEAGLREQERKITHALKRREAELSWEGCKSRELPEIDVYTQKHKTRAILWSPDSNLANCGAFVLNRVFFDWTCQYGMSPGRPLSLGLLVWVLCSILYFACIHTSGEAGLYRIYAPGIRDNPSETRRVERISPSGEIHARGWRRIFQFLRQEWLVLRASMFFSLMSAFNIGFRDINFGRWLRLLTRQEFDIKAVGWARVVAGWQSLLSVYFIALWVLTYFGRPFG